jgi:hypothetical protein
MGLGQFKPAHVIDFVLLNVGVEQHTLGLLSLRQLS